MYRFIISFVVFSLLFSCEKQVRTPNVYIDRTATVGTLDCSSTEVSGRIFFGEEVNDVSVKIPYTEGNGKMYTSQYVNSSNVTGLTAILLSDSLAVGSGSVVFRISGTPSSSGTAQFDISLGGKSCSFNVNVEANKPTSGYGPNIKDIDDNIYKTVFIGEQQWMAENLKTSKYNDGTEIPNLKNGADWSKNTTGAWVNYNNDPLNDEKYGKLYNWFTVNTVANGNKNICPVGWHVPSDAEWTILTDELGGLSVAGGKIKEEGTLNWKTPNTGATNSSLFTALPAGWCLTEGIFQNIGVGAYWWCTNEYNTGSGRGRDVVYNFNDVNRGYSFKTIGQSVRCIKD